jgi:hypothetical protein
MRKMRLMLSLPKIWNPTSKILQTLDQKRGQHRRRSVLIIKKMGHLEKDYWFLHLYLRLAYWIERGEGDRKGTEKKRGRTDERRSDIRVFNTQKLWEAVPAPARTDTIASHIFDVAGQMSQPSGSSGDPMQHIFT